MLHADPKIASDCGRGHPCSNRYLTSCPERLKASLEELYSRLREHAAPRGSIEHLAHRTAPAGGFCAGALYLYEPSSDLLSPHLAFGLWRLNDLRAVSASAPLEHSVAAAFVARAPVCLHDDTSGEKRLKSVAGALGSGQRIGVLWQQLSESLARDDEANPLTCFRAIRQAFDDCLSLCDTPPLGLLAGDAL